MGVRLGVPLLLPEYVRSQQLYSLNDGRAPSIVQVDPNDLRCGHRGGRLRNSEPPACLSGAIGQHKLLGK